MFVVRRLFILLPALPVLIRCTIEGALGFRQGFFGFIQLFEKGLTSSFQLVSFRDKLGLQALCGVIGALEASDYLSWLIQPPHDFSNFIEWRWEGDHCSIAPTLSPSLPRVAKSLGDLLAYLRDFGFDFIQRIL